MEHSPSSAQDPIAKMEPAGNGSGVLTPAAPVRESPVPIESRPRRRALSRRTALLRLAMAFALFCILEALVFQSGFYASYLEPNSTAGVMQVYLRNEKVRKLAGPNQILGVGDSRMPLLPRITDSLKAESGYTFASIAVAGTNPRCWYYMLRDVDPRADRYAAILIPLEEYQDDDWEHSAEAESDIHYLVPLLRPSDAWDFGMSFESWPLRWRALRASLFKGLAYKRDFLDLLSNYRDRMIHIRWARNDAAKAYYEATGDPTSMAGLEVDWAARKITRYPDSASPEIRKMLDGIPSRPRLESLGPLTAYRRLWLGRIVQHYRGSRTKLVFFRLPRGPIVRPWAGAGKMSAVRELAARGEAADTEPRPSGSGLQRRTSIVLMDEHRFDELERPEFFKDAVHMNRAGLERFSMIIAREIGNVIGPAR